MELDNQNQTTAMKPWERNYAPQQPTPQQARQELAKRELARRERALQNAHAAGDTEAAKILANEVIRYREAQPDNGSSFFDVDPIGYGVKDQLLHSATLGASDNILAGAMTPIELLKGAFTGEDSGKGFGDRIGDAYNRTAEPYQAGLEQYRQDNPGTALAANLAGGLGLGGGLAKAGLSATSFVPKALSGSKSIAGRLGNGLATGAAATADGAALGAGYAFNENQNVQDGATEGAAFGLAGAALAPVLAGAGGLVRNAVRSFTEKPDAKAARLVMDTMRKAGLSDEAVNQKMTELGADGFLVDAMGTSGEALARSASNVSPVAREALETASYGRQAGQTERLSQSLENAAGLTSRNTPDELMAALRQRMAPQIDEAYSTARAAGHNMPTEPFKPLMESHAVQQALKRGKLLSNERQIAQGGTNNASTLSTFDEAKKILDAQAVPDLGKPQTNEQSIAGMLAKRLRETVDNNVPEYAGARSLAQNATNAENAIRLGADGAKSKVAVDYGRRVSSMPNNQQEIGQGYASAKVQELLNARSTSGVTDRFFGNPQQLQAMQSALGQQADDVSKQIGRERTFNTTHRAITGNSSTARQLSEMIQFGAGAAGGAGIGAGYGMATGGDALTSAATGAAIGMGGRGIGRAWKGMKTRQSEAIAPHIAKALLGKTLPASLDKPKEAKRKLADALRLMLTGAPISSQAAF